MKTKEQTRSSSFWPKFKRDRYLYLLLAPGLIFFILFKYIPMWGIIISFQDYSPYDGVLGSAWVGLDHFKRFFTTDDFYMLFRNTMMINLLNLTFFFPMPVILALLLNELRSNSYKRVIQSVIYLPHFLSWVIIAGISFLLLSQTGIVNNLFVIIGLSEYDFLTNSSTFWYLLTAQSIWKDAGWGTIIFLAAIAGVNSELYEAAKIDGASRLRQAWHITLPAIRGVIIILFILRLGNIMDVGFEQVFLMMNGAVSEVADVFDTYTYRIGIIGGQFSYSTAIGLFKSIVGLILVVAANSMAKRFGEEGVY
ncbi:ABC transporter permease [Bacillus sp. FSL K6-3431]|uniref:ABC transporter permease n=1 Tax=Bacillus sp. FSL K6-3431 TaxID=2921500 RepID=UPI0030F75423